MAMRELFARLTAAYIKQLRHTQDGEFWAKSLGGFIRNQLWSRAVTGFSSV
jgi:hypothetical protein